MEVIIAVILICWLFHKPSNESVSDKYSNYELEEVAQKLEDDAITKMWEEKIASNEEAHYEFMKELFGK